MKTHKFHFGNWFCDCLYVRCWLLAVKVDGAAAAADDVYDDDIITQTHITFTTHF